MIKLEKLPKGFIDWVKKSVVATDNKVFYSTSYNVSYCQCTLCGERYRREKVYSRTSGYCACCNEKITYLSRQGKEYKEGIIRNVAYAVKTKQGFKIIQLHVLRDNTLQYKNLEKQLQPFAYFDFTPKKTMQYRCEGKYGCGNNRYRWSDWSFYKGHKIFDGDYIFYGESLENLKGTYQEKQIPIIQETIKNQMCPITTMHKINLYPSFEFLAKMGYWRLVEEITQGRKIGDIHIRLHQKKVNQVLGVPHSILQKYDHSTLTEGEIKAIHQLIEFGRLGQLTLERFKFVRSILTHDSLAPLDVFRDFGVEKVYNYIHKLRDYLSEQNATTAQISTIFKDFQDYRRECHELGWDLTNEGIMFPKDFYAAHENAARELGEFKKAEDIKLQMRRTEMFQKAIKKLLGKQINDGQFLMRICHSEDELHYESDKLRHCVRTYGDRIAQGTALIFFIRTLDAPEKPLYTMEFNPKTKKIVQMRGFGNNVTPKECFVFAEDAVKKIFKVKVASNKDAYTRAV